MGKDMIDTKITLQTEESQVNRLALFILSLIIQLLSEKLEELIFHTHVYIIKFNIKVLI